MATGITNLIAFQKSFDLAMQIFIVSKEFPIEEKYSLTDQIRRFPRAVCANIAETYAKRRYKSHFICKLTDSEMENYETQVWLKFAYECTYLNKNQFIEFTELSIEVSKLLHFMIQYPEKYCIKIQ